MEKENCSLSHPAIWPLLRMLMKNLHLSSCQIISLLWGLCIVTASSCCRSLLLHASSDPSEFLKSVKLFLPAHPSKSPTQAKTTASQVGVPYTQLDRSCLHLHPRGISSLSIMSFLPFSNICWLSLLVSSEAWAVSAYKEWEGAPPRWFASAHVSFPKLCHFYFLGFKSIAS